MLLPKLQFSMKFDGVWRVSRGCLKGKSGLVKSGQVKSGQVKSSQDWSSPVKTGQVDLYQVLSHDRSSQVGINQINL